MSYDEGFRGPDLQLSLDPRPVPQLSGPHEISLREIRSLTDWYLVGLQSTPAQPAIQKARKWVFHKEKEHAHPGSVVSPLDRLLSRYERWIYDDACLLRYLKARNFDMQKSFRLLMETIRWRRDYRPDEIKPGTLYHENLSGKMYRRGMDKMGRPVLYLKPHLDEPSDWHTKIENTVYMIEKCAQSAPRLHGRDNMILIVDFTGMSAQNAVPMWVNKQIIQVLTNHYVEILHRSFFLNCPWYFTAFWTVIGPMLHQNTRAKIKVNCNNDELLQYIDREELEEWCGGTCTTPYDPKVYWTHEEEEYEKYWDFVRSIGE